MSTAADTLYQAALQLPESDRADLAARIIDSIDSVTDADWAETWDAEIAKRVEELDQGKVKTIPWDEVQRRMVGAPRYSFKQLMARVTEQNIHAEIKTGSATGAEAL
jgi:putative addiction module component (TIGR02574 family)